MPLTTEARNYIALWKARAQSFVAANPRPPSTIRGSLRNYVESWQTRRASRGDWPGEVPLLDLLYKLIVWMPEFQNDPEHQVYLEAIMRCVAQGAHYSSYDFLILNATPHDRRSRSVVYSDLFEPIAQKLIEIDEDLLFAIPRHRLSIMTIHQSKGLEFPLVIVDVGSEFRTAHAKQRFKRFPDSPSSPVEMESALSAFTEVGPLRTARDALQRTFDDLTRLYYVAYSRAQSALLLVGLRRNIEYGTRIQNVATFWRRDGSWTWRRDNPPLSRRAPTLPESHPLLLM